MSWAETGLVLADQFRDGNVPAAVGLGELVDEAYAALPSDRAWQVSVRSDSAAYQGDLLDHWAGRGWRFAVSADMSRELRACVRALPEEDWAVLAVEPDGFVREWAEVPFVPARRYERKDALALPLPGGPPPAAPGHALRGWGRGAPLRHRDNDHETPGDELIAWQRGKAGTIEHVHRILKDELAAGVYPAPSTVPTPPGCASRCSTLEASGIAPAQGQVATRRRVCVLSLEEPLRAVKPARRDGVLLLETVVAGKVECKAGSTDGVAFGLVDAEGTFLHVDRQVGLSQVNQAASADHAPGRGHRAHPRGRPARADCEGGRPGVPSKLVQTTRQGGPPGASALASSVSSSR